jgi:hypothetical protein
MLVLDNEEPRPERTIGMTSASKIACLATSLLLTHGASAVVRADIPSGYTLRPGTVLSTHTPPTYGCPVEEWRLWIGQHDAVSGEIEDISTNKIWDLAGSYDDHGTFHLRGHKSDGGHRLEDVGQEATVDAQVESNGSMIFRMTTAGASSVCYNRTVFLPWFRNGNDFGLNGGGGGGG